MFNLKTIFIRQAKVKFILLLMIMIMTLSFIGHWQSNLSQISTPKRVKSKLLSKTKRHNFELNRGLFSTLTADELMEDLDEFVEPVDQEIDAYTKNSPGFDIEAPLKFLPDYKNPCWFIGKRLHCLPAYYILGYPKCATTDIWYKMLQHPQIKSVERKEIHWWTQLRFIDKKATFRDYYSKELGEALYKTKADRTKAIIGDSSPDTTWRTTYLHVGGALGKRTVFDAPRVIQANLIKKYTPNAKFIFMMRNPTDRAFSHHLYEGKQTLTIGKAPVVPRSQNMFHIKATQMIGQLQDCFQRRSVRACVYDPNLVREAQESKLLLQPGLYAVFISDWLKIFPRDQFLFINTDVYSHNPGGVLKKVFKFLDVDAQKNETIEKIVKEAERPNARTVNGVTIGPMWNITRDLLDEFYRPFNEALATLLGDTSYLFKKEAPGVKYYKPKKSKQIRINKKHSQVKADDVHLD